MHRQIDFPYPSIGGGIWRSAICLCLLSIGTARGDSVRLLADASRPQAAFAVQEIGSALAERGMDVALSSLLDLSQPAAGDRIVLALRSDAEVSRRMQADGAAPFAEAKPEGFSIRTTATDGRATCWVVAADAAGLMYGGLELAELIRVNGLDAVRDDDQAPTWPCGA